MAAPAHKFVLQPPCRGGRRLFVCCRGCSLPHSSVRVENQSAERQCLVELVSEGVELGLGGPPLRCPDLVHEPDDTSPGLRTTLLSGQRRVDATPFGSGRRLGLRQCAGIENLSDPATSEVVTNDLRKHLEARVGDRGNVHPNIFSRRSGADQLCGADSPEVDAIPFAREQHHRETTRALPRSVSGVGRPACLGGLSPRPKLGAK